ncbi:osmotically-inducible protein OsmY [Comamonas sp. BIGb0124]|uniref:BON domain-containing protein n=1 Tax=Comamonas sp. BIGb0124 TaxID=2485130 RepID=UPI000F4978F2|nr:BON domain-containing protein [Comamonas sp. BIGb0124]ROR26226.1 osmotically-inducible protein OsmY [Comamonas sp. BIGb0124]
MKRIIYILLAAAVTSTALTACFPLAVGAVGGGALVVADRRTPGAQLDDQTIELKASSNIRDVYAYNVHVNVTAYNRRVLLTGSVPSETHRQRIEQITRDVENVRTVFNELKVANSATLTERSSDGLLTGRVKGALIENKELSATSFKVTTERGTVYLLGLVTQREADSAADTVRSVPGVQRVVRVLEIITEEQRIQGEPQETSTVPPANPANVSPLGDNYREGTAAP